MAMRCDLSMNDWRSAVGEWPGMVAVLSARTLIVLVLQGSRSESES